MIAAAVSYWVAAALWLAWHRTLFQRFGLGQAQAETPEQKDDLAKRDAKFATFMEETTEAVTKLEDRVDALEDSDSEA